MITAMEIRKQSFSKGFRGFNEDEVMRFINQLATDYESLYSENSLLKEEIRRLDFEITKYRNIEATMNNSLIVAQQTAEDLKNSARNEAKNIIDLSKKQIAELLMVYQEIIKRMNVFNVELKAQMSGQLDMLEKNQKKIDELADYFYSADVKNFMEKVEKIGES